MTNTPSAVEIPEAVQGSDEWLARRRTGITATDVAGIFGVSPWSSPLKVWESKQDGYEMGPPSPRMRLGSLAEPEILADYEAANGCFVLGSPPLIANKERPWMLASLDGIAVTKKDPVPWIVEAKNTERSWSDGIPDFYQMQAQWQMAVSGLDVVDFAVWERGAFNQYRLETDREWQAKAVAALEPWWEQYVSGGRRPEPVLELDGDFIPTFWEPDPDLATEVPPEVYYRWAEAKETTRNAKAAEDLAAQALMKEMREATAATVHGETVATWKATAPRRVADTAALKAAGLYETYSKPVAPSRRLLKK